MAKKTKVEEVVEVVETQAEVQEVVVENVSNDAKYPGHTTRCFRG